MENALYKYLFYFLFFFFFHSFGFPCWVMFCLLVEILLSAVQGEVKYMTQLVLLQ